MKRKIFRAVICTLLSIVMLSSSVATMTSSADGTHGFYMTCDAAVTKDKSDGFMIDFYSDSSEALATYWSNANWSMETLPTVKKFKYRGFKGGGAYAGLQLCYHNEDKKGIMSMWRYEYLDSENKPQYIYADAIYGTTTTYDNEGSGTSCVMPYNWQNDQWYRELLYCWEDEETGYTFIGTWFYDYEAEEWTLFAYYNTYLVDSYIKGDVGQFLENFVESYRERYRSFRYRNIYFLPHESEEWVGSPTVTLRSDGNPKAHGEATLGVSEDKTYIWGAVDGKSEVDTDNEIKVTATLKQDKTPTLGTPEIEELKGNGNKISWKMTKSSTPQLSYKVVVTDESGKEIAAKSGTRPEVTSVSLDDLSGKEYRCTLTVTDVFGKETTATYETDGFEEGRTPPTPSEDDPVSEEGASVSASPSTPTLEPTEEPSDNGEVSIPSSKGEEKDDEIDQNGENSAGTVGIVLGIVLAVVVCAGVIVTVVLLMKKKRR